MKRKVVPTKASPLSMGYRKPAFLSGVASLVKNASQYSGSVVKTKIQAFYNEPIYVAELGRGLH